MHPILYISVAMLIGVVLAVTGTVIVLARVHKARMKKVDARYSPLPEFELDNAYAMHAANAQAASRGLDREDYTCLSKAAGL